MTSAPFDLCGENFYKNNYGFIYCPLGSGCSATLISLRFNLPDGTNSIQFALQGAELSIIPPIAAAVPGPATWMILTAGFFVVGARLRSIRSGDVSPLLAADHGIAFSDALSSGSVNRRLSRS